MGLMVCDVRFNLFLVQQNSFFMKHLDRHLYHDFKKTNNSNKFQHVKILTCVLLKEIASQNTEILSTVVQLHESSATRGFS